MSTWQKSKLTGHEFTFQLYALTLPEPMLVGILQQVWVLSHAPKADCAMTLHGPMLMVILGQVWVSGAMP